MASSSFSWSHSVPDTFLPWCSSCERNTSPQVRCYRDEESRLLVATGFSGNGASCSSMRATFATCLGQATCMVGDSSGNIWQKGEPDAMNPPS